MSKVLVDRELLERCVDRWACCAIVETPGAEQAWLELRAVVKAAQPAEAEGVEVVAWAHPDYCDLITDSQIRAIEWERLGLSPVPLVRQADQLAALSAVTAERDAAQKDAERYRWVSSGLHEAETLASIVICHGGYAEKVAERVDVYREAAMAAKEA